MEDVAQISWHCEIENSISEKHFFLHPFSFSRVMQIF
jgi:hypothetical protein